MAAFQLFSASRPFQPQLHHDHHSFPPLKVPRGADILTPTRPRKSRKRLKMIIITLGLLATSSLALAPWVMAEDNMSESDALVSAEYQQTDVYDAIATHPSVQAFRSQVCQARSQIDLANADLLPQISGRLVGGSSLSSHIEKRETNARRFDDREIDAVISVNQKLYDWGIARAGADIAENNRQSALLGVQIEQDRIAADIISTMMTHAELVAHDRLYDQHRQEIDNLAMQIQAGVEAGVNRLADLRVIKVLQLDHEIAQTQVQRQLALIEDDLKQRFKLDFKSSLPLYVAFRAHKPDDILIIDSMTTREVRRLDYELSSARLEIQRLQSERKPQLSATLDTTFFDADSYSQEYEMAGRLQFSLPLYDGGSNKARQQETEWRRRGITSERDNTVRNHRSQIEQVFNQIKRLDGEIEKNTAKIIELNHQIDGALAREGVVQSEPIEMATLLNHRFALYLAQETLAKEHDIEELRGFYFSDALGRIINLNNGGTSC